MAKISFGGLLATISYLSSVLAQPTAQPRTVWVPTQAKFCNGNFAWCPAKVYFDTEQQYSFRILGQEKVLIQPNSTTFRTPVRAGDGIFLNSGDTRVRAQAKLLLDAPKEIELKIGGTTMLEVYDNRTPVKNNLQVRAGMQLTGGLVFKNETGFNNTASTGPSCVTWGELSIINAQLHICKPATGSSPPFSYKLVM